jgi:hypothetical protein
MGINGALSLWLMENRRHATAQVTPDNGSYKNYA